MFCRVWSFIYLIIFQTWSFVLFLTLSRQFCILSRYITTAFARGSPSAPHWGLCNTFCPGSWFACLSFNNFEYIFENLSENSVEKYITPLCHPHLCNTFWPRSWFACLSQSFQHILNIYLWKFILHKSAVCSGVIKWSNSFWVNAFCSARWIVCLKLRHQSIETLNASMIFRTSPLAVGRLGVKSPLLFMKT